MLQGKQSGNYHGRSQTRSDIHKTLFLKSKSCHLLTQEDLCSHMMLLLWDKLILFWDAQCGALCLQPYRLDLPGCPWNATCVHSRNYKLYLQANWGSSIRIIQEKNPKNHLWYTEPSCKQLPLFSIKIISFPCYFSCLGHTDSYFLECFHILL